MSKISDLPTGAARTPLAERMAEHTPGQVTWPEPELGKWCSQCRFYTEDPAETHRGNLPAHKGICRRVYGFDHKAKPVPFDGRNAKACPQINA